MGIEKKAYCCGLRLVVALFVLAGCARVRLEAKEPIKVDVTMRLDIYQHVANDVRAIEDMISSEKNGKSSPVLSLFDVEEAFAQEGEYPSDIQAAIDRRKARRSELENWEARGVIGEGADGYAVRRDFSSGGPEVVLLITQENKDRHIIYQYVSEKNHADFEATAKVFAKRIQDDAPSGTPIEIKGDAGSAWQVK